MDHSMSRPRTSVLAQRTSAGNGTAPGSKGSTIGKDTSARVPSGLGSVAQSSARGRRGVGVAELAPRAVTASKPPVSKFNLEKAAGDVVDASASPRSRTLQQPRVHSSVPKRLQSIDVTKGVSRAKQASAQSGGPPRQAAGHARRSHVTQVKTQLQSLLKGNQFNMAQISRQLELTPHDTEHLMDLFEEERSQQSANMGKSASQILMKNPIFRGLKKFLLKDQSIKNVLAQKNTLMDIINRIKPLQTLCQPTKARFRNLMQMQMIKQDGTIPLSDVQNGDLIYIEKGCLEVHFESMSYQAFDGQGLSQTRQDKQDGEAELERAAGEAPEESKTIKKKKRVERFSSGDYIDFTWKMNIQELRDQTIKYVKCVPYDPATEVSIRERIPVEHVVSKKNLRLKQQASQQRGTTSPPQSVPTTKRKSPGATGQAAEAPASSQQTSTPNGTESADQDTDSLAQAEKVWKRLSAKLKLLAATGSRDEEGRSLGSQSSLSAASQEATCTFVRVPYAIYKDFVDHPPGKNQRNIQNMTDMLRDTLPYFGSITLKKGQTILNEFEEVEYYGGPGGFRPGTVLEQEGKPCENLYLILRGEVHFYKRILGLYDEVEVTQNGQPSQIAHKLTNIDGSRPLENFVNLKESSNKRIGMYLGSLKGPWDPQDRKPKSNVVAGEDSALFKQPSNFTLVAGENTLLFRFPVKNAFQIWPPDTLRQLRRNVPQKYAWLLHRTRNIEAQLFKNANNRATLDISKQIDDRTALNYPNANERAKVLLKDDNMRIAEWNEQIYLGLQNRRIQSKYNHSTGDENGLVKVKLSNQSPEQKCQEDLEAKLQKPTRKPLRGAVNEQLLTRMERLKHSLFTGYKEYCFFRSETLAQIQQREQEEQNQRELEQKRASDPDDGSFLTLQTLLKPKWTALQGPGAPEGKKMPRLNKLRMSSRQPPLTMKRVDDLMSGKESDLHSKQRSHRLQVAATFGRRSFQVQSSGARPTTTRNAAKRKPLVSPGDQLVAHETAVKNFETQTASTPMAAHPSITMQIPAPMQNLNLATQVHLLDSPKASRGQSPTAAAQQPPGQPGLPPGLLRLDLPHQMNVEGRGNSTVGMEEQTEPTLQTSAHEASRVKLRAASQSPPAQSPAPQATYPTMLPATQKREHLAASRGSSAKVPQVVNVQTNTSERYLRESKASNMQPTIGRIEVLNTNSQVASLAPPHEVVGATGQAGNHHTIAGNWQLSGPTHHKYNASGFEHSLGVASQDSASIHGNEKVVMTSKNINAESKARRLGGKEDPEAYQLTSTNSKSASYPAAQMSPDVQQWEARPKGRSLAMNSRHNAPKTRSSEFIMSSTAANALHENKRRKEAQRNLTSRYQASTNIFAGSTAGPTPKSSNTGKMYQNPSGPTRGAHNRHLTTYNMSTAAYTMVSPMFLEQEHTKPTSSYLTNTRNDIRPGSIYSSHRHAQRKFQNQKNIQANRNYLVMQTQLNQESRQFNSKEKYLKKSANLESRPQTQGTGFNVTMRSPGGLAQGRSPFSATTKGRSRLRPRFMDDLQAQSSPQVPKSGTFHGRKLRDTFMTCQPAWNQDAQVHVQPFSASLQMPRQLPDRVPGFDPSIIAKIPSQGPMDQYRGHPGQLQQLTHSLAPSRDTPPGSHVQAVQRVPCTDIRIPMQQEMAMGRTGDDSSDVALGLQKQSLQEHRQTADEPKNNKDLLHLVGAIQITDNQRGDDSMVPTQERAQEKDVSPSTPLKFHAGFDQHTQDQSIHGQNEMSPNTLQMSSVKGHSFAQNQLSSVYAGARP